MAVAIAFFCENAAEAIEISSISMILSLNCFYSIFAKKCKSHGYFKCIKKYKIILRSFCFCATPDPCIMWFLGLGGSYTKWIPYFLI